ncbi:hypothetical protein BC943DRAFT_324935 [Umbelopsis sp. AD052]|nr:hypothetical protein BC943DRAFT_324935 [Umbelopsis sp. AD052]
MPPDLQAKLEYNINRALNSIKAVTAREILSRSGLNDDTLAKVWDLSAVTPSPQLSFPEFAIAMYLTSKAITGQSIPSSLPDDIAEEVQIAVATLESTDTAKDTSSSAQAQYPMMTGAQQQMPMMTGSVSPINGQLTGMQGNGSMSGLLPPQMTGYQQMQPTGLQVPMMTGVTPMMVANQQIAMPTGMNAHNLDFTSRMMPMPTGMYIANRRKDFQSLEGKVKIPWAVTTEERERYREIFKAWDSDKKGFLPGDTAKEIFSQSGLAQNVLMQIWNLSDPNNQGKLNADEFAVAMHLIYRKINGYDVPTSLPEELVPPSSRELSDSVNELRKKIVNDIVNKKSATSFSSTSSSPISRSNPLSPNAPRGREKYKDDDTQVGYISSARRMGPDRRGNRTPTSDGSSPSSRPSTPEYRGKTSRISDLRKQITEHKNRLSKLNEMGAANAATPLQSLSYLDRKDIEEIQDRIKELEQEIVRSNVDQHNSKDVWTQYSDGTGELTQLSEEERSLQHEVQYILESTIPDLVSQLKDLDFEIAEKKKAYGKSQAGVSSQVESASISSPAPEVNIVGTGPNGEVTESDKIRAKAKAMLAARMGKITGQTQALASAPSNAGTQLIKEAEDEKREHDDRLLDFERSLTQLSESINGIRRDMSIIGLDFNARSEDEHRLQERNRFEEGDGVANDLRTFIRELALETASARAPDVDPTFTSRFPSFEETDVSPTSIPSSFSPPPTSNSPYLDVSGYNTSPVLRSPSPINRSVSPRPKTAADIKKEAERRVQERMAALRISRGLSPSPNPPEDRIIDQSRSTKPQPDADERAAQKRLREAQQAAQEKLRQAREHREEVERQTQQKMKEAEERAAKAAEELEAMEKQLSTETSLAQERERQRQMAKTLEDERRNKAVQDQNDSEVAQLDEEARAAEARRWQEEKQQLDRLERLRREKEDREAEQLRYKDEQAAIIKGARAAREAARRMEEEAAALSGGRGDW